MLITQVTIVNLLNIAYNTYINIVSHYAVDICRSTFYLYYCFYLTGKVRNMANESYIAYDDVFRTIVNDCSLLVLPMLNELFASEYTGNELIVKT